MKLVLFILPLIILISCEELYDDPPINTTNSVVVVEGVITDTLPPYRVRLSYSAAYNSPYQIIIPISGAQVSIIDNLGNNELLKQGNNGIYSSSKTGMRGIIGRSYKLKIILKDKTSFESDFLALYPSPSIDSLYAEIGQVQSISTDGLNKIVTNYGLNLFVNVNPLHGQDYYYKFKTFSIQLIHQEIYPQGKAVTPEGLPPQFTRYKWNTSDLNIQKNLKAGTATNIVPIKGLFVGFIPGIDYTYNSDTTDMPVCIQQGSQIFLHLLYDDRDRNRTVHPGRLVRSHQGAITGRCSEL